MPVLRMKRRRLNEGDMSDRDYLTRDTGIQAPDGADQRRISAKKTFIASHERRSASS